MLARRMLVMLVAILSLSLTPLSAHAQQAAIFAVRANQTINVHRGPSADQPIVGTLAAGMEARIFSCVSGCLWLEMGPNVWISSTGVTAPPDVVLPQSQSIPTQPIPAQPTPIVPMPTSAPGISAEEQNYLNFLLQQMATYTLSFGELEGQFSLARQNPSLIFTPDWRTQVTTSLAAIQTANTNVRNSTPPARFISAHTELVSAANNYEQAVRLTREGLDTMDVNKLFQAMSLLQEGNTALQRARTAFESLNLTSLVAPYSSSGSPAMIQPTPTPQSVAIQGCDPNYSGVCIPIVTYDLNCEDINARGFASIGYDPHNLDADNDGIACEDSYR